MKKTIFLACLMLAMAITGIARNNTNTGVQNKEQSANAIVYTCPMHPEVTSDKPGQCPKCGMNLEKKESVMCTCSMHPDVIADKPGFCPKCGMELISQKTDSKTTNHKMGMMGMMHGANHPHVWMYVVGGAVMVAMMAVMIF